MSLEQVNVERKLGRGQVVSLAHESKLHVVSLATLLAPDRDLLGSACARRPTELWTPAPWLLTQVPSSRPKRGTKPEATSLELVPSSYPSLRLDTGLCPIRVGA